MPANALEKAEGYEIHHIVERASAYADGYPASMVDGPENLVRIPKIKHWEITGWYMERNPDLGGLTPREYLRGKSWMEKKKIGEDALREYGVLNSE